MVAALWGILVWKEFENSGSGARTYLAFMFAFYTAAILAAVALLCELAAKRPAVPEGGVAGKRVSAVA